jgi:hypothetical protein
MPILCQRHAAHGATCGEARVVRAQAAATMFLFEHRQVRRHFAREVALGAITPK